VPHITELCLFAAAFVIAFAYGPSLAGLVPQSVAQHEAALTEASRRTPPLQPRTHHRRVRMRAAPQG